MDTAMPRPMPSAAPRFHAGEMNQSHIKYPHLPKSIPVRTPHVTYPSLSSTGMKAPATKVAAGMTRPILTKMGGHPADTTSRLPMVGNA